ncbi:LacI family DNA-binding transcriptional regulator [Paenibacillus lutrae]|uniref:LacI family DNA-binding transcriptional regulator n=1 Tax=Paenibacillus lutrae TaxID=2078573 RepID=A0A7X3FM58_9BACL|nr:LacI family DNA-binding transcriptional regulator [Paenibacillus lutrae]MVP01802.1 LacI family DNA-binding transcriptional regulator [Paenibacillus lutrae]
MVTRKDVAKMAGVSEATVSRVFNGVGPMKENTRQKVLAAAKELNYHPNAVARSFALGKSGHIGVILPYVPKVHLFSTYYFSEILSGIGEGVRRQGCDMLVMFRSPDERTDYTEPYRSRKVDGCIFLGALDVPAQREGFRELHGQNMPFVLINQHYDNEPYSVVDADHEAGCYEAVKHLIDGGFRRIAFLNGSPEYSNSSDRLRGYLGALAEAGIDVRQELILDGNYSRTSGYAAAQKIAALGSEVDAVFSSNDRMAVGLMQGLKELGIAPGRDLAIVGYDDSEAAKLSDPPLTSVYVPFFEMGLRAAEGLLKQIEGSSGPGGSDRDIPVHERLSTRLVVRQSSLPVNK